MSSNPPSEYFTELSKNYALQTGTSTAQVLQSVYPLISSLNPITSESRIHDNAAGPGTATYLILSHFPSPSQPHPQILVTDNNPGMLASAKSTFASYSDVTARELDSVDLSSLSDERFTHSFTNFSIFLFGDAKLAMSHVHRTLMTGGLAVVSTWKRFGFGQCIHRAQRAVRPDLPVMPLPGAQFFEEGVLAGVMEEAGFERASSQILVKEFVAKADALKGLREFMVADFGKMATRDWEESDRKKWQEAVDGVINEEVEAYGGMRFEAWVFLAKK
ncbi:hypothetical protein QQS21_008905 [Conoideocrella luteorostrata]|uniref:S-adenosyl-L-methionine-dependent methyltransferase n=1 Tax=Conoideocrella luteorostrata TaxID=1105319 RepID=A0AAJ0CKL7_9HYPO|nr:hypothetical protein QQS21_008905 [Conoideocrella luteorostrata]